MTRNEARQIINSSGRQHTLVVYFTKKNGERRRMVARYFGAVSPSLDLMCVWDMEKGAPRMVNLSTVEEVKVLAGRAANRRRFEAVKAELDAFFG